MKIDIQVRCPKCKTERNGEVDTGTDKVICLSCKTELIADAYVFAEPEFAPFVGDALRDLRGGE